MPADWDAEESALRTTAGALRARLSLMEELAGIGDPVLTGSNALKVMVARDIDVTVTVERMDHRVLEGITALASRLVSRDDVRDVLVRDDSGRWNDDAAYPDGYYLCVHALGDDGELWSIDIWVIAEPDRQPGLAHLRTLAPRITPTTQATILRLKRANQWTLRDGSRMPSVQIYWAVLDHGVTSPDQFRALMHGRLR